MIALYSGKNSNKLEKRAKLRYIVNMAERDPRFLAKGHVHIAEVTNTEAVLKNLSNSGLCIESNGFLEIAPKSHYTVDIIPEKESNIDKFNLEVESRWVRTKKQSSESGFVIVIPPGTSGKEVFEQYLAYLAGKPESH
jgi:hypothetical protein